MVETTSRVVRILILLIAVVGAVDAVRGEHWDQFGMLIVIAFLVLIDLTVATLAVPTVAVRPDLVEWLEEQAARTDDSVELVADRALASYRATSSPPTSTSSPP